MKYIRFIIRFKAIVECFHDVKEKLHAEGIVEDNLDPTWRAMGPLNLFSFIFIYIN